MSKANDGGPAFPLPSEVGIRHFNDPGAYPGISLRDWFAGKALVTLREKDYYHVDLAQKAYSIADAMIAERAKGGE